MMIIKGKAWKFGDHVDTDIIIPACYMTSFEPEQLAPHCMENLVKDFRRIIKQGDIMVGGENFGCGSSREHAPIAIKATGISCIIAKSFARIFFRNAINIGLPILECSEAVNKIKSQEELEINIHTGQIKNITNNECFQAKPFPDFLQKIITSGGLINYVKEIKEQERV